MKYEVVSVDEEVEKYKINNVKLESGAFVFLEACGSLR